MQAQKNWLRSYAKYPAEQKAGWSGKTFGELRAAVLALETDKCSEADLDSAMDNSRWAALDCSECGNAQDVLVHFGDDPGYDAIWQDLCKNCLAKGIEVLKQL